MPTLSLTISQAADKIALDGWTSASSTPITYGFRSTDGSNPDFVRFTASQIAAAEAALELWSDVANIRFERVGAGYTNSATILFQGDTSKSTYAYAYFPGSRSVSSVDGDVFINPSNGNFSNTSSGSYEFMAIMHEIGHAIGLDHPGAYNGGSPTYSGDAEYIEDSRQFTVMSYFDAANTGAQHGNAYASTPLLHDIAAIQLLYGANTSTRTGDTVYGFDSNADREAFRITSASQDAVFTIWDSGGRDTLNFSGYSASSVINLNDGTFSNVGGLIKNVSIAAGAMIENATGGSGNDYLRGNEVSNRLLGGGGNDTLVGGFARDVLIGGSGADDFDFNSIAETGKKPATRDVIADFTHNSDDIDLKTIDANGSAFGNTAFKFLNAKGAAFTGVKGQLHWSQINVSGTANDKTIIEGDINGDRQADFQIEIRGLVTLSSADFIL
jgi:serralysin